MPRKSNEATCKLETSLSEFCFMLQGSGIATVNKRKNRYRSPKIGPQMGFKAQSQGFLAFGVFLARMSRFPKVANPCYALVKLELAKVPK